MKVEESGAIHGMEPLRHVIYMAAPLRPTPDEIAAVIDSAHQSREREPEEKHSIALKRNLERAMRWLRWLRRSFPGLTFIAPWIAAIQSGEDDSDPAQREAGLVDACAVIERCSGLVAVGGRRSQGMDREILHAIENCAGFYNLIGMGSDPPNPGDLESSDWVSVKALSLLERLERL